MKKAFVGVISAVGVHATNYTEAALRDQITDLPGIPSQAKNLNQFSGYIPLEDDKQIFYWLIESMGEPSTDPIALWTNGGPGKNPTRPLLVFSL